MEDKTHNNAMFVCWYLPHRCFNILGNLNDVKLRSKFFIILWYLTQSTKSIGGFISVSVWNNAITNNKLNFDDPLMHILYYI
jgi:hypothetical protein